MPTTEEQLAIAQAANAELLRENRRLRASLRALQDRAYAAAEELRDVRSESAKEECAAYDRVEHKET